MTGNDIPVDGQQQRKEDVFVGVTISYPSEHQLAVSTEVQPEVQPEVEPEVEPDQPLDGGENVTAETEKEATVGQDKETTVEFLDPADVVYPIDKEDSVKGQEDDVEEEINSVLEPEEDGVGEEEGTDENDGEDDEKRIYVATVESDYDVSEQLKAMNDVELAISEGFIEQDSYLHEDLS